MILALIPTGKGFAYAVVKNQHNVVNIGRANLSRYDIEYMMRRIQHVIACYTPDMIILPRYDSRTHSARGELLINATERYAEEMGTLTKRYDYEQVKTAFSQYGASTRFEMAFALAKIFPKLKSKLPKPRKNYMNEPYALPMFSALALAMTDVYMSA